MEGAIWLHRQLLDSSVFASEKRLKIWIWLLLKAAYKNRFVPLKIGGGQTTIELKRGELIFGRFTAEESLNIDGSTIYKSIKYFESEGMVNITSNNHFTIISICNYDIYQCLENNEVTTEEQPSNNQVTTEEQPSNNQVTTEEQPSNNQVTTEEQPSNTYKKVNKVNKDKKEEEKLDFDFEPSFELLLKEWFEYKKHRKESYKDSNSKKKFYEKLYKFSNGNIDAATKIVDNSISNNWAGIFEIKENQITAPKQIQNTYNKVNDLWKR